MSLPAARYAREVVVRPCRHLCVSLRPVPPAPKPKPSRRRTKKTAEPPELGVRRDGARHVTVGVPECRGAPRQRETFEVTRVLPLDASPEEIFAGGAMGGFAIGRCAYLASSAGSLFAVEPPELYVPDVVFATAAAVAVIIDDLCSCWVVGSMGLMVAGVMVLATYVRLWVATGCFPLL